MNENEPEVEPDFEHEPEPETVNLMGDAPDSPVVARIRAAITPIVSDLGLELYDLEFGAGLLKVTVDTPPGSSGGVDVDQLTRCTRLITREFEHSDPVPGNYTLEVSSPGLERNLRTPRHWTWALGRTVSVKTFPNHPIGRRFAGTVTEVTDTTVTIALDEPVGESVNLALGEIAKARTTFEWGPAPKPGGPKSNRTPSTRPAESRTPTPRDATSSPDEEMIQS